MFIVIGIEYVDYVSKKTNNRVKGKRIYYTSEIPENKGIGQRADVVFVNDQVCPIIQIGDEFEIYFNRYGNVAEVRIK